MKPQVKSDTIQIPITFDAKGGTFQSRQAKGLWTFLVLLVWLFSSVLVVIVGQSWGAWLYPPISLFLFSYVIRFLIFREVYFKAKRKELLENDYSFDHTVFWNIYEIGSRPPYVIKFGTGLRGIFIAFDKDVIVGKEEDHDYSHYEAIAEAYKQMEKRGIECIHLDYMDTVGKDERMAELFEQASKTENADLRKVVLRMYDHTVYNMNRSYASYDIYCFYSYAREDLFWAELQIVMEQFKNANYIRARMLNRDVVQSLVESVINIADFSINRANDGRLMQMNSSSEFIRPIWVERDGQQEVLGKTLEELAEAKRVALAEKTVKRKRGSKSRSKRDQDVDLFAPPQTSEVEDEIEI